jgi:hypothetical protein
MKPAFRPRIIPRLETWPWLVRLVQTRSGKVALAAVFFGILTLNQYPRALVISVALLAIALWPQHRRLLVALATFYTLLVFTLGANGASNQHYLAVILFFLFAGICTYQAHRRPDAWIFRRPVRNLLVFYCALVVIVSWLPFNGFTVATLSLFVLFGGKYIWFLGYALLDRRRKGQQPLLVRLFHFQPFWGSTNVPYPKGESYLARIEARTGQDLAVTQLKGLKLVLWASVLKVVLALFDQLVHGSPGCFSRWLPGSFCVPYLQTAIAAHLARQPFPRDLCWLSVMANFCAMLLNISIMGHFIIGICRMAGFNALRNTYRPLASTTIAEFYNRVYYYFKELLVDFFFYPAYFRYFKDRPRLRLFFATLAAAGFGNLLYHILASIGAVSQIGLWRLIVGFHVYAIYAMILGLAIGISQIRSMGRPPAKSGLVSTLGVMLFYCLIMVLDSSNLNWSIADYGSFLVNLFIPFPR